VDIVRQWHVGWYDSWSYLFIAYVYDASRDIHPKFADDFAGIAVADDIRSVEMQLQELISELLRRSEEWDLKFNLKKTKVMVFGLKQTGSISISANGHKVEQVEEFQNTWE